MVDLRRPRLAMRHKHKHKHKRKRTFHISVNHPFPQLLDIPTTTVHQKARYQVRAPLRRLRFQRCRGCGWSRPLDLLGEVSVAVASASPQVQLLHHRLCHRRLRCLFRYQRQDFSPHFRSRQVWVERLSICQYRLRDRKRCRLEDLVQLTRSRRIRYCLVVVVAVAGHLGPGLDLE